MKLAEHKKIVKKIVEKKNREVDNIISLMENDRDFWLDEAIDAGNKFSDAISLLEEILPEIDNEKITTKISDFLETTHL